MNITARYPISAVVATKNSQRTLHRCLSAIRPFVKEIVVVDGLSQDGTLEIAKKYADLILSDGGRGLAYAHDLGWRNCSNEYTLMVGSDVILNPALPAVALSIMAKDRSVAAIAGKLKSGIEKPRHMFEIFETFSRRPTKYRRSPNYPHPVRTINLENTLIRRSALDSISGFDYRLSLSYPETHHMTYLLACEALRRKGYRLHFVPVISKHMVSAKYFLLSNLRNSYALTVFNHYYRTNKPIPAFYWLGVPVSFVFPIPNLLRTFFVYSRFFNYGYSVFVRFQLSIGDLVRIYLRFLGTMRGYKALRANRKSRPNRIFKT